MERAAGLWRAAWRHWVLGLGLACVAVGLLSSPALLSIGYGLLALVACVHSHWASLGQRLCRSPAVWGLLGLFALALLGGLYPAMGGIPVGEGLVSKIRAGRLDHTATWLDEVRIKLPLLIVALSLLFAPPLSPMQRRWIPILFLLAVGAVGLGNIVRYVLDYEHLTRLISQGKGFPIVIRRVSHIYYGVVAGFGVLWSLHLLRSARGWGYRLFLAFVFLVLLLNVHFVGSRTGLFGLYLALLVYGFGAMYRYRKKWAILVLLLLPLLPTVAYLGLEAFRHRIDISLADVHNYHAGGDLSDWSMGRRFAAWDNALQLIAERPLLGYGPANTEVAMHHQYEQMQLRLLPERRVYAHNQYLETCLAYGLVGGCVLLLMLLLPLLQRPTVLQLGFAALILFAFGFESLLERQIGVGFIAFMLLWFALARPVPAAQS
ncbi:MAG: O-antigen ligase family protein [Bacteroidetes bacterium]|nr:O-antigen ligase family protein [Bacteroidota bacterium]